MKTFADFKDICQRLGIKRAKIGADLKLGCLLIKIPKNKSSVAACVFNKMVPTGIYVIYKDLKWYECWFKNYQVMGDQH